MDRHGLATFEVREDAQQRLQRRSCRAAWAHDLDDRRLRELVPRRPRQQHHAVAGLHVRASARLTRRFDVDAYETSPPLESPRDGDEVRHDVVTTE